MGNAQIASLLGALASLLGDSRCLTDEASKHHFGRDWTRFCEPDPVAVLFPESIAEVQQIIALARRFEVPVVPSGGRTGLSGGAMAAQGELVLSLERMNRILASDASKQKHHLPSRRRHSRRPRGG